MSYLFCSKKKFSLEKLPRLGGEGVKQSVGPFWRVSSAPRLAAQKNCREERRTQTGKHNNNLI